jgi:hypothetical protein
MRDSETEPWNGTAVDLSRPWKAMTGDKPVFFCTLTIIDVFDGWVKVIHIYT